MIKLSSKRWIFIIIMLSICFACQFFSGVTPQITSVPSSISNSSVLVFKPDSLPDAQKSVPFDVVITIENVKTFAGKFTIEKSELPAGLSLQRVPGENATHISGTPRETGVFNFVLTEICEGTNLPGQTGQKEYKIIVK